MLQFFSPNSLLGRWLAFLLDALFICLAWLVCSLPIVTIGASTAAVHVVARNWALERSDCDLKNYFRAFRENLRSGTAVWLILLVPLALIVLNGYYVWFSTAVLPDIAHWMVALSVVVWLATAVWAFPLQAIFENKPLRTVTNALRIAGSHFTSTLILMILFAFAILCTLLFPFALGLYVPAAVFLSARISWNVFRKLVAQQDETDEGE